MNAYVIGKLRYMLPLYTQANSDNINKIHKIIMRSARGAIGNYFCRFSITKILNICNNRKEYDNPFGNYNFT